MALSKTSSSSTSFPSLDHLSPEAFSLRLKLEDFVTNVCQPAEVEYEDHMKNRVGPQRWSPDAVPPCVERLKAEARRLGLWNLFLPHQLPAALLDQPRRSHSQSRAGGTQNLCPSVQLSIREYGVLCEIMGKSFLAPEACNCSAPDTGNMEVLLNHGTAQQQARYLLPLLDGSIRSCFLMTERNVASSDATNIETRLTKKVVDSSAGTVRYILNGSKWWSTGAMDPRCKVALVLARMDYSHPSCGRTEPTLDTGRSSHGAHTVVILPMDTPGIRLVRPLTVFGYDDAPHGHAEVELNNVTVDASALILGEGKGFQIAQSRLGPGRIHHCMRAVGMASRCYELMLERSITRATFGKALCDHGGVQEMIADSRTDVEAARLLTLSCAAAMDDLGAAAARDKIAMIKVAVPQMTLRVVDRAVQVFGGAGVCGDFPLARILAGLRTLRIADGPDAVHKRTVALMELKKTRAQRGASSERSRL